MQDYKPPRKRPKNRASRRRERTETPRRLLAPAVARAGAEPQPEKPPLAERLHPVAFALTAAKAVCVLLAAWLVLGLGVEAVGLWHFPLDRLKISGNRTVADDDLIAAAGVAMGQSLGALDPFTISARLAAQPKMASADVRRVFPGLLMISVEERVPKAVLQFSKSGRAVIDREGRVLGMAPVDLPARLRALPRIYYGVAPPMPGSRLMGAGPAQAMRLLADAPQMGVWGDEEVGIEINRPSGLTLHLPKRKQRVLLPRAGMERALLAYMALAASLEETARGTRVIDMRAIDPAHGGRAVLGR